jgi:multiple sugar transport system permease protein
METPKVYAAIAGCIATLAKDGISKSRKNSQQGYSFRGIDDIFNALAPVLAANALCIIPRVLNREVTERQTKTGATLFYVVVGCALQFVIGTGLAFLCSQPISGKIFFRVIFFIPLMITPLGVGYAFKMILDITKGPFQPFWEFIGLRDWAWSTDAWAARWFVVIGDSWQWIPFIFICMLAALENVPKDHVEAAQVDGASSVQIFRDIIWPQIVPVAATVILIRMIEAFKIVDLPNIMTSGGPGIATESMSLHSFFIWRANDYGMSAAVAYMLLLVTVVVCASFFNYVVLKQLRSSQS